MEATRVTIDEIKARLDRGEEFTFLDARNDEAWSKAETKLPGAIRVPANEVEQHLSEISHDRTVITYCTCPHEASSAQVAVELAAHGRVAEVHVAEQHLGMALVELVGIRGVRSRAQGQGDKGAQ